MKRMLIVTTLCLASLHAKSKDSMINTLPSGLSYQILQDGGASAPIAESGQTVEVHYTGYLDVSGTPGKKFDSSVDRKKTFVFALGKGHVIKGWDEGVAGMRVSEKRRLIIPAALGYGKGGVPGVIPPNSGLIFDVELIAIK